MARLVMKFGGTSVADIDRIRNVARHVKREVDAGHEVAVVVSAMSGITNQLVAWCEAALKERRIFDAREYDAVVATGEQVTAGLLAITLQDLNINARSWQGWQLPMLTSDVAWLRAHSRIQRRRTDPALQGAQGGSGHRRLPGPASRRPAGSPRSAAADRIPRRSRSRPRSAPTAATSIPMSTASTPPIRASCRVRAGSTKSPSRKCWSSLRSAPRCCRCARSSSAWCTMSAFSSARASMRRKKSTRTACRRAHSFATRKRSWSNRRSPASPSPGMRRKSRSARFRTSPAWRRPFSARSPKPASMST